MASIRKTAGRSFRETYLDRFPDLDRDFYTTSREFFENRGFQFLGDIEDSDHNRTNKNLKTCLRVMAGDDGVIRASIYHIGARGLTRLLNVVVPNMKFISLETEFTDGSVIVTTNDFFSEPRHNVDLKVDGEMPAGELLELHKLRVNECLDKNPGLAIWKAVSLGEVIEGFGRLAQKKKKMTPWTARGFGSHMYKFRRTLAKIAAILLIGCLVGIFWMNSEASRYRKGVGLTAETYNAGYSDYVEKCNRPPRAGWISYASGLLMMLILFGGYEAAGNGGSYIIGKLFSSYRYLNEALPFSPDPAVMKKIRKSAASGKILALLVIGLLIGGALEKNGAGKNSTQPVSLEKYVENYPGFKEKMIEPLQDPISYVFQSMFVMFLLIALYELGGKTLEAGSMLYHCRRMDLELHLLISIAWVVVGFFGSGILFIPLLLRHMAKVPLVIELPVIFGSVFGVVFLLQKLFDHIPVACPQCRGSAYRTKRQPVTYTCGDCKHVQGTNFSWGGR